MCVCVCVCLVFACLTVCVCVCVRESTIILYFMCVICVSCISGSPVAAGHSCKQSLVSVRFSSG